MTDNKNTEQSPSRTPALDRLFRVPEGFKEKLKSRPEPAAKTVASTTSVSHTPPVAPVVAKTPVAPVQPAKPATPSTPVASKVATTPNTTNVANTATATTPNTTIRPNNNVAHKKPAPRPNNGTRPPMRKNENKLATPAGTVAQPTSTTPVGATPAQPKKENLHPRSRMPKKTPAPNKTANQVAATGAHATPVAGQQTTTRTYKSRPRPNMTSRDKSFNNINTISTINAAIAAPHAVPAVNAPATPLAPQGQKPRNNQRKGGKNKMGGVKPPLKIISLGGLGEIGKNITVYETEQDIVIVDCGLAFPGNDLLGVDLVIPDFTYLVRNRAKIRGLYITHGHEDHIGSVTYLLREINVPIYGTKLTIGLLEGKLKEHGLLAKAKLNVVTAGDTLKAGSMSVEFIHVNHSFPDACALAMHTPAGVVIQTGDFKIDYTPIQGNVIDLARFGQLGDQGVLALLCDSTNAEKPGFTLSESTVGASFRKLFQEATGKRIIIATFASNVHRIQQVIDAAVNTNRKVAVFGRSMVNVVQRATDLGYLKIPVGVIIDIDSMRNYTDGQLVVMSTGSQGETMSALTRMSNGDHRNVHIGPKDYIIISATPIPGNEKLVGKVINELMKLGAEVIYERMYDVHVSGHACQEEIKAIIALTRPKFYMPVHGEFKHLTKNAGIAKSMGYDPKNIIISEIGKVVQTDGVSMKITDIVPSGNVLVDGLGVGDIGSIVLRDRKILSEDGLIIAVISIDSATGSVMSGPDLVSRGFVYVREAEDMMADAKNVVKRSLDNCTLTGFRDWSAIKGKIRDDLSDFIYSRTKRKPMILPVIQEI